MKSSTAPAVFLSILIYAAALMKGAYDLWAATLICLVAVFLLIAMWVECARDGVEGIALPLRGPVLAAAAAFVVSYLFSTNPSESFLALLNWLCALCIFYFSVNVFQKTNPSAVFRSLVPLLWIQLAVVGVELYADTHRETARAFLTDHAVAAYFFPIPEELFYSEKMGTLINANVLAAFVLPILLVLGHDIAVRFLKDRKIPLLPASGVVAGLLCLLFAKSAAAWMCLMIGCALMWARVPRKWLPYLIGAVAIMFASILAYKFLHVIDRSVDPYRSPSNRFFWWASALKMFGDHPLFGIGPGAFPSAYLSYKLGGTENTLYAHGFPFAMLAETGLIGVVGLIGLALSAWRDWRIQNPNVALREPWFPAVGALLVFYGFNIGHEYLVNLIMFAVLAGALSANNAGPLFKPRWSVAIVTVGAALAASTYIVAPFLASRSTVDGDVHLAEDRPSEAEKSYLRAIQMDGRSWEPYAGLARLAFDRGDFAQAVEFQREALRRNRLSKPLAADLENYRRLLR